MKTVVTHCPRCDRTDMVASPSVLVDVSAPVDGHDGGSVSWVCAECRDLVTRPVPWHTVLLLVTAGAPLFDEDVDRDPRPEHPESPPAGPPLTHDDVLDLHMLLEQPTWLESLEEPRPIRQQSTVRSQR